MGNVCRIVTNPGASAPPRGPRGAEVSCFLAGAPPRGGLVAFFGTGAGGFWVPCDRSLLAGTKHQISDRSKRVLGALPRSLSWRAHGYINARLSTVSSVLFLCPRADNQLQWGLITEEPTVLKRF